MSDTDSVNSHVTPEVKELASPDVTTKYRTAGEISNEALKKVIERCIEGANIVDICTFGDDFITKKTAAIYNRKENSEKPDKGIAFPTCISINEISGHFSPLPEESITLRAGDLVKIDLGCHIDGYVTIAGHTLVLPEEGKTKVTGRKADCILAAITAAEAAIRTIQVGNTNTEVTKMIETSCEEFKCTGIQGEKSHQMKRFIVDGNQWIANKTSLEDKPEEFEFGLNEVYGINIVVSTGDGKMRETEHRTTVFKRAVETKYQLKTFLARSFLSTVNKRHPALPFSIRSVCDARTAKIGVSEAMRHELLNPFPVVADKPGEFVAHVKFTVLILPGGTKKITGLTLDKTLYEGDHKLENQALIELLKRSVNPKKKKSAQRTPIEEEK